MVSDWKRLKGRVEQPQLAPHDPDGRDGFIW